MNIGNYLSFVSCISSIVASVYVTPDSAHLISTLDTSDFFTGYKQVNQKQQIENLVLIKLNINKTGPKFSEIIWKNSWKFISNEQWYKGTAKSCDKFQQLKDELYQRHLRTIWAEKEEHKY